MPHEILLFELADGRYGLRVESVREVLPAVTLSPVPGAANRWEGILNLRGQAVPVVDVRAVLQLPPEEIRHTDSLIVFNGNGRTFALRADRILQIAVVADDDVETVGADVSGVPCLSEALRTSEGGLVFLFEPDRLSSCAIRVEAVEASNAQPTAAVVPSGEDVCES